ncbi:MAG: NosD domain-containing protein [Thermoproteota archaeon]
MKSIYAVVLILLALSVLAPGLIVEAAWSGGTIIIKEDGSVDPSNAPIRREGDVYVLTADISIVSGSGGYTGGIRVERDNVVVEGGNHLLTYARTPSDHTGVHVSGSSSDRMRGVTVRNLRIRGFRYGISLSYCSGCEVTGNDLEDMSYGIYFYEASNNTIAMNNIKDNRVGIQFWYNCLNNEIVGNNIERNEYSIVFSDSPRNNRIYLNSFVNNEHKLNPGTSNVWDDGSRGNYWSDYTGADSNSDGVGDTPYVIDSRNVDRYPLMRRIRFFFINVSTSCGAASGSGWYEAGSTATVSVASATVGKDFFTNYVFEGWSIGGSIVSNSPTYSFTVDKTVTLVANWRTETNFITIGLIVGAVIIVVVALFVLVARRKRAPVPPPPPPPPPMV